jgi:hypothetical protein
MAADAVEEMSERLGRTATLFAAPVIFLIRMLNPVVQPFVADPRREPQVQAATPFRTSSEDLAGCGARYPGRVR